MVAPKLLELARLRNEVARSLGFESWFSMALASEEQAMMSADAREAIAPFMEKRKPNFTGN